MPPDDSSEQDPQHVNRSELSGQADLVQARDVHGGVHFHGWNAPSNSPPPRQLPGDVRGFVNRQGELAFLEGLLAEPDDPVAVNLVVIVGTAGVGKTSLALRWAHSVQGRFPDGQLYVNLKGYDAGPPATAIQVLERFLRALGTPAAAVPADPDERAALYRSRLADRRMLILLDNAATVRQVRPLLPGSSRSLVLVTTRGRLSGLVARDGGRRLTVSVLPEPDAINLIEQTITGYRRGDSDDELREDAARLFRLLGLHPGADFGAGAATALAGTGHRIHQLLDVLVGANLLEHRSPGRYELHDLLRAYALDQAHRLESADQRRDALQRVLDWYLLSADAALAVALPQHRPTAVTPSASSAATFTSAADAMPWCELEHDNLVAATRAAATARFDHMTWRLATMLRSLFMHLNNFEEWLETAELGLAAARAIGDVRSGAEMLESLGKAYFQARRLDEATDRHTAALTIRREIGDRFGEAVSMNALGLLGLRRRSLVHAVEYFTASMRIARELGNGRWEAQALGNLGEASYEMGDLSGARELLERALAAERQLGDRPMAGNTLFFLSMTLRELGLLAEAQEAITAALNIADEYDNSLWLAHWLVESARIMRALGRPGDALAPLQRAATIQRRIGDRSREATALDCAGETYRELGQPEEAARFHRHAAQIHADVADRWQQAIALNNLALAVAETGQPAGARESWLHARSLLAEFEDPRAVALRRAVAINLGESA